MEEIKIIQGDTYTAKMNCIGIDNTLISKMIFSCNKLGVCEDILYDESAKCYVIKLTPDKTASMAEGVSDFDITANFKDGSVRTLVYRKKIIVQRKVNTCG